MQSSTTTKKQAHVINIDTSLEEYTQKTTVNLIVEELRVSKEKNYNPTAKEILEKHDRIFSGVVPHEHAGSFRKPHEHALIAGRVGADSGRIERELNLLHTQYEKLAREAKTTEEKLNAIALYHIRYEYIHPFLDGNGRTGRSILTNQVKHHFPETQHAIITFFKQNKENYFKCLKEAGETKNLTPLSKFIGEAGKLKTTEFKKFQPSPYRLAPYFFSELTPSRTLNQELKNSTEEATSYKEPVEKTVEIENKRNFITQFFNNLQKTQNNETHLKRN
jgi:fido (protein-threonine AMPylation protein)